PNLPLRRVNLKTLLQKKFRRPVAVANDAQCFAMAEARLGAGKSYASVFGLTLGTGIGGGWIIDKKLVSGSTHTAGEIGHTLISFPNQKNLPPCSCGKIGHLEEFAGGARLIKRFRDKTGSSLKTIQELEMLYRKNHRLAKAVVQEANLALAMSFSNLLTLLNPDCLVVGGGLAKFSDLWQPAIRIARRLVPFPELKQTPILYSKLGDKAVLIGASLLRQNLKPQAPSSR
ncbi:ROK family protein, partial [Candidatus Uhrbacteria bacterium]|nr:ROK family protein [Candidatus Uhrbacteria bacterium]